jgi:anthranilate phosphoribosyltransferase
VTTQITGVSDHSVLPTFRGLVDEEDRKRIWICWNEIGVDELLSITDSHVYDSRTGEEFLLEPKQLGLSNASFDDLLPVSDLDETVPHFLRLISGDGPPGAIESIRLNAAALAVNAEVAADWEQGLAMAAEAMERGEPAKLIERLKAHGEELAGAAKAQAG